MLGLLAMLLLGGPAAGSPLPLSSEQASTLSAAEAALREAQRAGTDSALEPTSLLPPRDALLQSLQPGDAPWSMPTVPLESAPLDLVDAPGRSIHETLRGLVNVDSGGPAADVRSVRARGRGDGSVPGGFELGLSSNEWAREAMQTLVDMTVQMQVNERGQASFNLLGVGNFTMTMSGDRSEIALASDDRTLFSIRRAPASSGDAEFFGQPAGGGYSGEPLPKLREAVQYLTEAASHPLSLLIYCIIAVYVLLWSVLSQQARRRARRARGVHPLSDGHGPNPERAVARKQGRASNHRSAMPVSAADASGGESSGRKRQRKRIRVRIRYRKPGLHRTPS